MAGDEYNLLIFEKYLDYDNYVLGIKTNYYKYIKLPRRNYTMFCLSHFQHEGTCDDRLYRISENSESIRIWDQKIVEKIKCELDQEFLTLHEENDKTRSLELLEKITEYLKNNYIVCFHIDYD